MTVMRSDIDTDRGLVLRELAGRYQPVLYTKWQRTGREENTGFGVYMQEILFQSPCHRNQIKTCCEAGRLGVSSGLRVEMNNMDR